ncbi:MAG: hypothetical protein JKY09_02335 [Crocinitomicaceae bacterium]|nr:hypothetical protein [Crocinitomicaceae bacterium]
MFSFSKNQVSKNSFLVTLMAPTLFLFCSSHLKKDGNDCGEGSKNFAVWEVQYNTFHKTTKEKKKWCSCNDIDDTLC